MSWICPVQDSGLNSPVGIRVHAICFHADALTLDLLQGVISPWLHRLHLQGLAGVDDSWMPVLAGARHCTSLDLSGAAVSDMSDLTDKTPIHCIKLDGGLDSPPPQLYCQLASKQDSASLGARPLGATPNHHRGCYYALRVMQQQASSTRWLGQLT